MESSIFPQIFSYLYDGCRQLEDMIFRVDHTYNQENGYLTDQLFIWENIPRVEYDREQLRNFLTQKFKEKWLQDAEIKKTEDGNSIKISYDLKSIVISMNKERRNATLSLRERKECEFIVRKLDDQFAIDVRTAKRLEEVYMITFLISYIVSIPKFIISLIPLYGMYSPTPYMKVLRQDKRFTQTLRKVKYQFDKTYELIIEN